MATTLTFTIDLKGEARLQWKKFDDQVKTLARQCCTSLTGGTGILGYMLPVALWNTFPPNIRPDGTIVHLTVDNYIPYLVPKNNHCKPRKATGTMSFKCATPVVSRDVHK